MNNQTAPDNSTDPSNVKRPDTATYMRLFPDDETRCAPGALMANNGRLAYLVHLKEMIQAFEVRADVSAPITLRQRREDLLDLKLDEKNTRKVLPKIRMVLEVLENRAEQALPEGQSLQQAVADGLYQANVPFHHAWESIKATLATKRLHLWDVLRSTHPSYPAFAFDNLTLADQRAATVLSTGFSPQLRAQLLETRGSDAGFYTKYWRTSANNPLATLNTTQKLTKALGLTRRELRKLLAVDAIGQGNTSVARSANVTAATVAEAASHVFGAAFINNAGTPLYLTELAEATPAPAPESTSVPIEAADDLPPQAAAEDAPQPDTPAPAPAPAPAPTQTKKKKNKVVQIVGLTTAHLDRLQRILRIQRALGLSASEADALVMAALRAEGQTADYHLTENTLRALGMFRHLQQKYAVTPWQYAAFLDVISPYAANQQVPFYDKLFAPANSDEDAPKERLQLDDKAFDHQASAGDDAQTLNLLAVAMKVNREVLRVVLEWVREVQGLNKPTRSLAVISACYRIVTLLRLFGRPIAEGVVILGLLTQEQPAYLQQLAGKPRLRDTLDTPDIIDVIAGLMNTLEWLQEQGLETLQAFALLNHEQPQFQKDWAKAFGADTFKPDPRLSLQPDDKSSLKTAGNAKQAPRLETKAQKIEACCKALSRPLQTALKLEASTSVEALLTWARIDPEALYQRMLHIHEQCSDTTEVKGMFLLSDAWTWTMLQRYSALIKLFKLSDSAVKQIALQPAWFNLDAAHHATVINTDACFDEPAQLDVPILDFTTLYQLGRYKALLTRLAKGKSEAGVLDYLKQANDTATATATATAGKKTWAELEALLGLPATRLSALNIDTPPKTLRDLDRLLRLVALADKHQLSLDTLLDVGKLPLAQHHADFTRVETALRQGHSTKQRKAQDAQLSVAWRDALMQWMLVHWAPMEAARNWINSPQTLADYLLIDLQVSHEPLTTRTLSATASLQRYLHQIHSHLENGYRDVMIGEAEREEWENFSSSYERWELRKSAHNEPQNFIDPTRRKRKTTAFKDLENLLAQGKCTSQDVQTALETYLSTFEKLSNIQPISAYAEGTSPLTDTYHFIGKTNVEPVEYYWRTLDMSLRDQDGAPSMLAWGEWEKITLTVSGQLAMTPLPKEAPLLYVKGNGTAEAEKEKENAAKAAKAAEDNRLAEDLRTHIELIRPVIIAGRRYAVWAEWGATAIPMGADNKASDYYPLRVCFAFQQTDGAWSPPNELLQLDGRDTHGKFDPKKELKDTFLTSGKTINVTTPTNGTAPGNVFLKTKDFQPGLMAMVNQMGGREHDPWFMVMLYDTQKKENWQANRDYFLVTKDLLLIESKRLDQVESGARPIEEKMVSNWLRFFHDPRTAQHPYMGATIYLDEVSNEITPPTKKDPYKYAITKSGNIIPTRPTLKTNGIATLNYHLDGEWKTRTNYQTFDPFTLVHGGTEKTGTAEITIIENFEIDTDYKKISEAVQSCWIRHAKLNNKYNKHHERKLIENIEQQTHNYKHMIDTIENQDTYKVYLVHASITTPTSDFNFSNFTRDPQISLEPITTVEFKDPSLDKYEFTNGTGLYVIALQLDQDDRDEITIGVQTEANKNNKKSHYQSFTTITLKSKASPSRHIKFSAKLTATIADSSKPNWTLSSSDDVLFNTPEHQALKLLPQKVENKEIFNQLKQSLLKTRYTTAEHLKLNIEQRLTAAPLAHISVHQAINAAIAQNRPDIVEHYLKLEKDAILKEIGPLPTGINLDAAIRLRHYHPEACSRILLHIDPDHQMILEDELIADGHDKLSFRCPINLDITRYRFKLDLNDGTNDLGSLTHEYEFADTPDDAIPSVQLRRNNEQALYLDMKEANDKREAGQISVPNCLRLNTLFGKQLVALATQSVRQALSWNAQCLPEPRLEPGSYPSTVDFYSANGLYFWELFFHVPFLVTWLKRQNREYGEAWRSSTHHLIDPYRTWVPDGNHPPPFWLTQPILGRPAFAATDQTSDPDELAYADPERYKKALHLFVVENWQRQGDDLYRQLDLDTLVEAALCYDKALRLIGVLPENLSTAPVQAQSLGESKTTDFTPPLNNKLVELRNLLRNRLFNLRHGLTLDGKPAAIMLDPATLDRIALGYGVADQDRGNTARIARPVPPCRYEEARKCAGEAVLQLIELGQSQLRFYERDASLQLSLANKANIIKLMDYPCRLQAQALELAKRERETVLASKHMVQDRQSYYQGLIDEGITDLEHASRAMAYTSQATLALSLLFATMECTVAAAVPTILGLSFGGNQPSKKVAIGALVARSASEIADLAKDELRLQADYQLRSQQWQFEADQASFELKMLDQQLLEQDIRIKAASIAVEEARATQAAHRAEYEIMTSVFSNHATYLWLIGRMSQIYASAYDATLSLCLMAEACLQFELGDFNSTWIKTDGWLDNWRGMLAGEALERDLMLMDVAAIRDNERPLDIRKDLSLLACMKWTHEDLHAQLENDQVFFELAPWHFDVDFPGHFQRRIERIVLSFKVEGTSSSSPIPAMLAQTNNKLLLEADTEGARHLYNANEGSPATVLRGLRPDQNMAVWSVNEFTRHNRELLPLAADTTRYQPFEGTGLISTWVLSFPGGAKNNPLLYSNGEWLLEDINVQLNYSAVEPDAEVSETFRAGVKECLAAFNTANRESDEAYKARAATAKSQFAARKAARSELKKALDKYETAKTNARVAAEMRDTIEAKYKTVIDSLAKVSAAEKNLKDAQAKVAEKGLSPEQTQAASKQLKDAQAELDNAQAALALAEAACEVSKKVLEAVYKDAKAKADAEERLAARAKLIVEALQARNSEAITQALKDKATLQLAAAASTITAHRETVDVQAAKAVTKAPEAQAHAKTIKTAIAMLKTAQATLESTPSKLTQAGTPAEVHGVIASLQEAVASAAKAQQNADNAVAQAECEAQARHTNDEAADTRNVAEGGPKAVEPAPETDTEDAGTVSELPEEAADADQTTAPPPRTSDSAVDAEKPPKQNLNTLASLLETIRSGKTYAQAKETLKRVTDKIATTQAPDVKQALRSAQVYALIWGVHLAEPANTDAAAKAVAVDAKAADSSSALVDANAAESAYQDAKRESPDITAVAAAILAYDNAQVDLARKKATVIANLNKTVEIMRRSPLDWDSSTTRYKGVIKSVNTEVTEFTLVDETDGMEMPIPFSKLTSINMPMERLSGISSALLKTQV